MQVNISHNRRRWERRSAAIPISLVLEAGHVAADKSAITVDISPRGAKELRTNNLHILNRCDKLFAWDRRNS